MNLRVLSHDDVVGALTPGEAIDAILGALRGGFQPADDPSRVRLPMSSGLMLLMPSEVLGAAGVKVIGLAPGNEARRLETIQGAYLHLDAVTFQPVAVLDGAGLTAVRTPAVSLAAVRERLCVAQDPHRIVVFGTGRQARSHLTALLALVGPAGVASSVFISRRAGAVLDDAPVLGSGSPAALEALRTATVVVCATAARSPLFKAHDLARDAIVIAVGSHDPGTREVPGIAFRDAIVVVEEQGTALREAGDVVMAITEGHLSADNLVELGDIARDGSIVDAGRVIVKSTGMSWEDVVVAEAIITRTIQG